MSKFIYKIINFNGGYDIQEVPVISETDKTWTVNTYRERRIRKSDEDYSEDRSVMVDRAIRRASGAVTQARRLLEGSERWLSVTRQNLNAEDGSE
jgi:hypothetical protein